MAGKGQRRREKNYRAAHGQGYTRLPPPPDLSSSDAVPSKLRKLMSLAGAGSGRQPFSRAKGNTINDERVNNIGEGMNSNTTKMERKRSYQSSNPQAENKDETEISMSGKKKKGKNNKVDDLRFEALGEKTSGSKRTKLKKQFLLARKKKHKKSKTDDADFPGHEEIRFGDVVQAPPKLTSLPKTFKTTNDASQERLRRQAVDAYRQRKGWASRPGVKLPPPITSPF